MHPCLPDCRSVLEVGCAEGLFSAKLADRNYRVTGIDVSSTAIRRARERCPSGEFVGSGLESFRCEKKFDLAVASEVIYYSRSPSAFIKRLESLADRVLLTYDYREHDLLKSRLGHVRPQIDQIFSYPDGSRPDTRILLWSP